MKVDYWFSTKKIQLKENSNDNFAEKDLKENSKFKELWNFSIKQKKKKKKEKVKDPNSKNFFFLDTLSNKFPSNCTKNLQHIFTIPFFLISLYKISF